MDAAETQAAQLSALEFCQKQLRQAAVHGQGLLQRIAELSADAESREAEMQALRERCSDLHGDNERLRLQISACRHQFDAEVLQCMSLQSRCDELTAELERCQRGLHMEGELMHARQQILVLQQSCDSERRLKQAAEQRCDATARDLKQYREELEELRLDKNRAQIVHARATPPARKQVSDDALQAEIRDLKAQLEDARRLNSLFRIASMVPDSSCSVQSPADSMSTHIGGTGQVVAITVEPSCGLGGSSMDNSNCDGSSSSNAAVSANSSKAAIALKSPSNDCISTPVTLKQSSWPPQPDDSPRSSPSTASAPQMLRDFFALSVV
jgi:hypothetical protein